MNDESTTARDEQAVRDLLAAWHRATASGDAAELRRLMADDVVFLAPGQPPLRGAAAFIASFEQVIQQMRIEPSGAIQELQIIGERAYCWTHLKVTVTSRLHGTSQRRGGDALTILHKQADQSWVIWRDANLLVVEE